MSRWRATEDRRVALDGQRRGQAAEQVGIVGQG
jgi:hypothetical protein